MAISPASPGTTGNFAPQSADDAPNADRNAPVSGTSGASGSRGGASSNVPTSSSDSANDASWQPAAQEWPNMLPNIPPPPGGGNNPQPANQPDGPRPGGGPREPNAPAPAAPGSAPASAPSGAQKPDAGGSAGEKRTWASMSPKERADLLLQRAHEAGITDHQELAIFMGQMQEETGNFTKSEESLHYHPNNLLSKFRGRNGLHTSEQAKAIVAGGEKSVANAIYGGKWGHDNLGNTQEGDGWKYRGRGYVHLTGYAEYKEMGKLIGQDLVNHPELASDPKIAAQIAVQYWKTHVAAHGDQNNVKNATRDINGGTNGLTERKHDAAHWKQLLDSDYKPGNKTDPIGQAHAGQSVRPGAHGPAVTKLQNKLRGLGYHDRLGGPIAADGHFGPGTRAALEAFQRANGLVADGVAGPKTQEKLDEALKQQQPQPPQ